VAVKVQYFQNKGCKKELFSNWWLGRCNIFKMMAGRRYYFQIGGWEGAIFSK